MQHSVSISEMRVHLPRILEKVRRGCSFVVTSRGLPVARIGPLPRARQAAVYGRDSTLVNLTPHIVAIADGEGNIVREIQPTEPPARVSIHQEPGAAIDGVPFAETVMGQVENLPDPDPDGQQVYIVSRIVLNALSERTDLVCPDMGPDCIREHGRIIAVRRLTR